jgi:hypothetical protein
VATCLVAATAATTEDDTADDNCKKDDSGSSNADASYGSGVEPLGEQVSGWWTAGLDGWGRVRSLAWSNHLCRRLAWEEIGMVFEVVSTVL